MRPEYRPSMILSEAGPVSRPVPSKNAENLSALGSPAYPGISHLLGREFPCPISNIRYSHQFDDLFGQEISLSVGINNVFNDLPQLLPTFGGFESRLSTPWGR